MSTGRDDDFAALGPGRGSGRLDAEDRRRLELEGFRDQLFELLGPVTRSALPLEFMQLAPEDDYRHRLSLRIGSAGLQIELEYHNSDLPPDTWAPLVVVPLTDTTSLDRFLTGGLAVQANQGRELTPGELLRALTARLARPR